MLPDYWLERPLLGVNRPTQAALEEFLSLAPPEGADGLLDLDSLVHAGGGVTPWQFLSTLAQRYEIVFHGTGDPNIESFEPRKPIDFPPFRHQQAVFATTDPIWAMFYAIVDRERHRRRSTTSASARGRRRSWWDAALLLLDHWRCALRATVAEGLRLPPAGGDVVAQPMEALRGPHRQRPSARESGRRHAVRAASGRPGPLSLPRADPGHDDRLTEYAHALMAAAPWPD